MFDKSFAERCDDFLPAGSFDTHPSGPLDQMPLARVTHEAMGWPVGFVGRYDRAQRLIWSEDGAGFWHHTVKGDHPLYPEAYSAELVAE